LVSRLVKEKNLDMLIDAFRIIARSWPKAVLMLVGGGPEEESLRKRVEDFGLANRVVFTGWQSPDDRNRHLRAGDLFIFPSLTDTQGLVLCEAMAAGLPCVAVNAMGAAAVVRRNVDGVLSEGTSHGLANATMELLRDPERFAAMSTNALKGSARFSEAVAARRLLDVYDSALSRPRRPRPRIMHSLSSLS
jgi:glycosyltransferase involved in cell wall biosynthesis